TAVAVRPNRVGGLTGLPDSLNNDLHRPRDGHAYEQHEHKTEYKVGPTQSLKEAMRKKAD
ncbi:hypothetical protein NX871_32990, partial [Burkholderia thailandensis]|uniref:hypothetical protein n=1 Tax=Burkholderia thailandensis TaxID=57975 RepID=UPI00217E16B0